VIDIRNLGVVGAIALSTSLIIAEENISNLVNIFGDALKLVKLSPDRGRSDLASFPYILNPRSRQVPSRSPEL